ncbi:FAD-dependent monooxygenase [Chitinibacter bivalviorum]|uniref:FAD-dependent monooxygenase n=1 Tax=Chitinibacter bivalviorum TaxID=2739434 RepID=A0A7H9BFK4_9NEIS|nr:FAD-dependent monooxygenase [Chitinibacter bivalviorum]QLG87493.1 FAD-dependent monooxygenase [Chitinibacter bivalviorum]
MLIERLPLHIDILIVGGGPVGALLAQRLCNTGHDVLLVEAKHEIGKDPRALAIAQSSIAALQNAKLWHESLGATPIKKVHVSQAGTLGRTVLDAQELDLDYLGCTIPYQALAQHALDTMKNGAASIALGVKVSHIQQMARFAQVKMQTALGEHEMTCRLLVLADGGQLLAQLHDVKQSIKSYEQHAVLAQIKPRHPHQGIAFERFADDGPLALLPNGIDYTLVWTQTPEQAAQRLALSDEAFIAEVELRFADRMTGFAAVAERASWPLALKTLNSVIGQRVVLIGNAAQTLHPVAGQGLNLGLRDAETLAQVLAATPKSQLGEATSLQRYKQLRQRDAGLVTAFTDSLIGIFDSPSIPIKHARSLGLLAIDHVTWLRKGFAKRMVYGAR